MYREELVFDELEIRMMNPGPGEEGEGGENDIAGEGGGPGEEGEGGEDN